MQLFSNSNWLFLKGILCINVYLIDRRYMLQRNANLPLHGRFTTGPTTTGLVGPLLCAWPRPSGPAQLRLARSRLQWSFLTRSNQSNDFITVLALLNWAHVNGV